MDIILNSLPINGQVISSLLSERFSPVQIWVMVDIETLSDTNSIILGELWRLVQEGPVKITTDELCNALQFASQIISLDIHLEDNPAIEIFIDDGLVVKFQLKGTCCPSDN